MKATCNKCGQTIKNVITIDGKTYGTTCAERVLGVKLPFGFTGDYNVHLNKIEEIQAKCTELKKIEAIYWAEMDSIYSRIKVVISRSYDLSEWELNFCRSLKNRIESMNGELTPNQFSRFETIEAPIVDRINYAKKGERRALINSKFTELIPFAKSKGWNATQLREYINTIV